MPVRLLDDSKLEVDDVCGFFKTEDGANAKNDDKYAVISNLYDCGEKLLKEIDVQKAGAATINWKEKSEYLRMPYQRNRAFWELLPREI